MNGFRLDAGARMALDVALGSAAAMGDDRCGTEHLLFGVVATARGDVAKLADVFALDPLRLERSIKLARPERAELPEPPGSPLTEPPLTTRARDALLGPALERHRTRSTFDVMVGLLADSRSGAAAALRVLGVRVGDVRRLAELGAARLGQSEVEGLLAALDRRRDDHQPWWGPAPDDPAVPVPLPNGRPLEIARSQSAVATLDGLVAGPDGFAMTLSFTSRRSWLLPPAWEAREELVPGHGTTHRLEPDVVVLNLRLPDGTSMTNREPRPRWSTIRPPVSLVRLGERAHVESRNDRRVPERRRHGADWWVWPRPDRGEIVLELEWPAEAVRGSIRIDADQLDRSARELPAAG